MYIFFLPLIFLPLLEIFAFIRISSAIGLGFAFLWLAGATYLGFFLLRGRGPGTWSRVRKNAEDVFTVSDLFDGICLSIGAVLLIFPGFISDFLAIPFLIAPLRKWLFGRLRDNPDNFVRRHTRPEAPRAGRPNNTIIDGEFRKIDNNDHLTPP